jgi:hypothetical protein
VKPITSSVGPRLLLQIHELTVESRLALLVLLVCLGLYFFHLRLVWKYAVDVPFMDEWASFEPDQLPNGLSVGGLFAQHNEHRLLTTRLFVWLQYQLNGWNLEVHQRLNFAIYGFIILAVGWFSKAAVPEIPVWLIAGFLVFLLSPIGWWNHFMGYQSQVHFWLLFYLVAAYFLFRETERWLDLTIGSTAATLSTYSMAGGFVSSLVLVAMFALFKAIRIHSAPESRKARSFAQLLFVLGFLGTATLLWLLNYQKPSYHPALVLPYQGKFWSFFLNIISLGFGIDMVSNVVGGFCLLLVIAPLLAVILINKGNLSGRQWRIFVSTVGVLAILASVSTGRAGSGIEQAKESRYFEFAMLLIPLSEVSWAFLLYSRKFLQAAVIAGLWIFCLVTFGNNWKEFPNYRIESVQRKAGLRCLSAYYQGHGDGDCPTLFPAPIPARFLEEAKVLNVSFYRRRVASLRK